MTPPFQRPGDYGVRPLPEKECKAARTTEGGWGAYRDDFPARAVEPPTSPVTVSEEAEDIVLVPYGSTEIRITHFPWRRMLGTE